MGMKRVSSVKSTNPVAEVAPSSSNSRLESLPIETRLQILSLLPNKSALALGATNKSTNDWVMHEIYRNEAKKAKKKYSEYVPAMLQWAVWENHYGLFQTSIAALGALGLDPKDLVLRGLSPLHCELIDVLRRKRRSRQWLNSEFPRKLIGPELRSVQLIDLACFRGNAEIVKALADLAGNIDQTPRHGYLSHYAYAANAQIYDMLSQLGASPGRGDRDSVLLAIVIRIGERNQVRRSTRTQYARLNRASDPDAVLEHMLSKGYLLEHNTDHNQSHPLVAALKDPSAVAFKRLMLHKPILQLWPRGAGMWSFKLLSEALRVGNLEAISLLLEHDAPFESGAFCAGYVARHRNLYNNKALVHQLLDLMPKNATNDKGQTLAQWAVVIGDFQLLQVLSQKGFDEPQAFHFSKGSSSKLMDFLRRLGRD